MALTACLVLAGGCNRKSSTPEPAGDLLTPDFAPETDGASAGEESSASPGSTDSAGRAGSGTATTRLAAQAPAPTIAGATTAAITDPVGDLTPSPLDRPPPWADLAGATLIRRDSGLELRVRLGGDTAPATTDDEHTMNIASFYDVDGDGQIDFEVWANLSSGGWGASYFSDSDKPKFQEKSGVTVTPEGAEVVLRFPRSHLRDAERFRWALASEWGRYEILGTVGTARDDAPDGDAAARFPG